MAASTGRLLSFIVFTCILMWYLPAFFGVELASRVVGVVVAVILAYVASGYIPPNTRLPVTGKAVLVTGCDTGIGHALARHLDSLGFCVFAGCLFKDGLGASELKEASSSRLTLLQLDVTSDDQVKRALQDIQQKLKETGEVFWGVVNNAGLITFGESEWIPVDMFKNVQEVNTWGLLRVTQAFLPLIRRSKGRVVNISSITGRFAPGFTGPYYVSKYAVEALSDGLRIELAKWGVKVVIIEPGNYGSETVMFKRDAVTKSFKQVWERTTEQVKEDYGEEYFDALVNFLGGTAETGSRNDLRPVSEAVTDGLTLKHPSERYMPAGFQWKILVWAACFLPASLMDHAFRAAEIQLIRKLPQNKVKAD